MAQEQSKSRSEEFTSGATNARPADTYYGVPGTTEGPDFDFEKRWSQSRDDD